MEQFNLEEYKKNPNRKIATRDGRVVRIICCDAKNSKPIVALVLTRSISQREFDELPVSYFNDGTYYGKATEDSLDLFFADEEPETIEIPFGAKDSEFIKDEYFIPEGCKARIEGNKVIIEKIQKDELTELQKTIEEDCECYVDLCNKGKSREELREWVKCWCHRIKDLSLKEVLKEQNHYVAIHEDDYCSKLESQYFKGHEDALKELPKWKKITEKEQQFLAYGFLSWDGYYLSVDELKQKLPKE